MRTASITFVCLLLAACGADPGDSAPWTGGTPDGGKGDDPDQCADGFCLPDGDDGDPDCEPQGCEGECGVIEDGCGGTIACGPCDCEPRTCEDAGATCGTVDDGCDGELDCDDAEAPCRGACEDNQCVCPGDASEPNDESGQATDLGALSEADGAGASIADQNVGSAQDADWYKVTVADDWSWGNPIVNVSVTAPEGGELGITAYYFCDYGADYFHTCEHGAAYSDTFGAGCQGPGQLSLQTECSGTDESGTIYVRITPGESAVACESYSLSIDAI